MENMQRVVMKENFQSEASLWTYFPVKHITAPSSNLTGGGLHNLTEKASTENVNVVV
jgi:hypothetical protein